MEKWNRKKEDFIVLSVNTNREGYFTVEKINKGI